MSSRGSVRFVLFRGVQVANRHLEVVWMCSGEVACVVRDSQQRTGRNGQSGLKQGGSFGRAENFCVFLLNSPKPGDSLRDLFISLVGGHKELPGSLCFFFHVFIFGKFRSQFFGTFIGFLVVFSPVFQLTKVSRFI